MSQRPTRILVIRFSSIGDLVLTAPAVASLREAVHGPCEVHFLTKSGMHEVVAGFGDLVDCIHTIEKGTAEVQTKLQALEFDYVVDLHNNVRSRAVKRALGLISFTVDKQNWAKWLLVRGWRTQPVDHIVERYIASFAGAFSASVPAAWPALFENATPPEGLPESYQVIALGAAHAGKQLTPDLINALIQRAPMPVVLVGGAADAGLGKALADQAHNAINLAGTTTVAQSAAILRCAHRVYTGDTGMMHLAAAMGTPVTSFWGCTRPNLGMAPWRPAADSYTITPETILGSRPCSKLGNRCQNRGTCMAVTAERFLSESVE